MSKTVSVACAHTSFLSIKHSLHMYAAVPPVLSASNRPLGSEHCVGIVAERVPVNQLQPAKTHRAAAPQTTRYRRLSTLRFGRRRCRRRRRTCDSSNLNSNALPYPPRRCNHRAQARARFVQLNSLTCPTRPGKLCAVRWCGCGCKTGEISECVKGRRLRGAHKLHQGGGI